MKANKLRAKIIERGLDVDSFAKLMDMNKSTVYRMLNNPKKITIERIIRIKEVLEITNDEANAIFFG